jgi:uncharacterized repeat protein (TIGR03806 family)
MLVRATSLLIATFILGLAHSIQPECDAAETCLGLAKRPAWTTSRVVGSPEPPLPFTTERVYPNLQFNRCLDLAKAPGSNRLFVVEQGGKVLSFEDRPDVTQSELVLDFAKAIDGVKEVYAIAFHPNFAKNRYCYVCYIKAANLADGTHVARFQVAETEPPTIDPSSETTLLTWLSGGHNGCCLKFGPDGYLYVSTGDGSGPNPPDTLRAGQDISELLASILRIDVDQTENESNYRVPADNPFRDIQGARGEVWAYGLRNPWRMSFDSKTGDLWVGDVGWELWESLIRVERGGNYGWSVMEARQPTNPSWPRGPSPIVAPTLAHPHSESSSITEGLTYYGTKLKELYGHHIYGDYDTGKIWGFKYEQGRVSGQRELADTTLRIVGFGEDHSGETILLDHVAGTLNRLVPNSIAEPQTEFPRRLSESGLFASLSTTELTPAAGVVPFSINSELWSDHAFADRWVAIPNDAAVKAEGAAWKFPTNSVLVRTLSLNMKHRDASSRRRIETQLLHFDGIDWQTYTYQWNQEQTDATLVAASGSEISLAVEDPDAPDKLRRQTWRFASRAECQRCHNRWSGPALGFNAFQLNRNSNVQGATVPQLDAFFEMGLFEKAIKEKERTEIANPLDSSLATDDRARSYLHANCAHCHRMHAGSSVLSKMQFDLALAKTDMLGVRPSQGSFGMNHAEVIAAGDPYRSVLLYRMAKLGGGRMPHIGSSEVDLTGLELIENWIRRMPTEEGRLGSGDQESLIQQRADELKALTELKSASTVAMQLTLLDRLLATSSGALMLCLAADDPDFPKSIQLLAIEKARQHQDVSTRDLFERFLSSEHRVQRIGSDVNLDELVSMRGNAVQGRKVFFETAGVACKSCHQIFKEGIELGPDLSAIGKKYSRAQILENLLEPSKAIDPKYATLLVETVEGEVLTGLLVSKDERLVVLKDIQNKVFEIPTQRIERMIVQRTSLMPDSSVRDMTKQQVADLLEYLSSLQ